MDELLGLALIIYVVVSALLGMLRREQARTRPRHPEEAEDDVQPGPWRDWEEELRDLFERTRERQQAEEEAGEAEPAAPAEADDDRPWLDIEPIPLPDEWSVEEAPWPRYEEPGDGEGEEEPVPDVPAPALPPPVPPVPPRPTAPSLPGRAPAGSGDVGPSYPLPPAARTGEPSIFSPAPSRPWAPATDRPGGAAPRGAHPGERPASRLRRRLRGDRAALREAVVLMEVLGPPRALRPHRPPWARR